MRRLCAAPFAVLVIAAAITIAPASAVAAGTITGTATVAGTGTPITGLSVCAEENYVGGVNSGCTSTDAAGNYRITGLPAGSRYQVEFSAFRDLNFLTQYYNAKEGLDNWDPVTVGDGLTTSGVDAAMKPGAQISGYASEQGTAAPATGVEVCVLDPAANPRAEEFERCATTDNAGNYTVRSLPAGNYIVVFARFRPPIDSEKFGERFYAEASTKDTATAIAITPPETRSGVDAVLVNRLRLTLTPAGSLPTHTRHRGVRVGFRFHTNGPVYKYVCKRDDGRWHPCSSPQRFWASVGRHVFRVRAVDQNGSPGPVAEKRFRITHISSPGRRRSR